MSHNVGTLPLLDEPRGPMLYGGERECNVGTTRISYLRPRDAFRTHAHLPSPPLAPSTRPHPLVPIFHPPCHTIGAFPH